MNSEFNPLVQRVDALLRRHMQRVEEARAQTYSETQAQTDAHARIAIAPPAPPANPDEDIPVLTEIVDPAALAGAPAPAEDLRSDALVLQIEGAVMDKLLAELDRALDQRLGRSISDLLEQVLHGLRAELSVSVRQMVREAVAAAVAREIAERLRSE